MQRNTNTRDILNSLDGAHTFRATFKKFGVNPRFPERGTVLLTDVHIVDENNEMVVCDHCWVSKSKRWNFKEFSDGDLIEFSAEVEEYFKEGVKGYFKDYTLGKIRSIKKMEV